MKIVIDRIEDGIATIELENGKLINVPAVLFEDCREGDIVNIVPDKKETAEMKKEIEIDLKNLFDN